MGGGSREASRNANANNVPADQKQPTKKNAEENCLNVEIATTKWSPGLRSKKHTQTGNADA